jgi:hypothetical protein
MQQVGRRDDLPDIARKRNSRKSFLRSLEYSSTSDSGTRQKKYTDPIVLLALSSPFKVGLFQPCYAHTTMPGSRHANCDNAPFRTPFVPLSTHLGPWDTIQGTM